MPATTQATKGPTLAVNFAGTDITVLNSKTATLTNTTVPTTTDGDVDANGQHWDTTLATVKNFTLSGQGVAKAADFDTLLAASMGDATGGAPSTVTFPSGATLAGTLNIDSLGMTGETGGAVTFDISLSATEAMTFTNFSA